MKSRLDAIGKLLREGEPWERGIAANELGKARLEDAGPYIPDIAALLKDEVAQVREAAASALGDVLETTGPYAAALTALLRDEAPEVRNAAAGALKTSGEEGAKHAAKLLEDEREIVRIWAATVLGYTKEAAVPHLAALIARLKDESPDVQDAAVLALLEAVGARAAPCLAEVLDEDKSHTQARVKAARLLARLGGGAAPVVEAHTAALGRRLRDDAWEVREAAAMALAWMPQEFARAFLPDLQRLREDPQPLVRQAAWNARREVEGRVVEFRGAYAGWRDLKDEQQAAEEKRNKMKRQKAEGLNKEKKAGVSREIDRETEEAARREEEEDDEEYYESL